MFIQAFTSYAHAFYKLFSNYLFQVVKGCLIAGTSDSGQSSLIQTLSDYDWNYPTNSRIFTFNLAPAILRRQVMKIYKKILAPIKAITAQIKEPSHQCAP